jgi:hypothetical protein
MNLNLKPIEEAWGSGGDVRSYYTKPDFQQAQLNKYMVPKSSQIRGFHPNNITESVPTRMDVSVYDQNVIRKLYNKTPENRTLFVTDLIRRHFGSRPSVAKNVDEPSPKAKEYYLHERCMSWFDDNNAGEWMIIVLFVVLLLDKFLMILKNS